MQATRKFQMWVALGLGTAAALLALAGQTASAARATDTTGAVPSRLGSPDPRAAVAPELLGPIRPDGAALRASFDDLAARAAKSRQASSRSAEIVSGDSGFSWRDAGVGAGGALLAVVLVGLAAAALSHRGRSPLRV